MQIAIVIGIVASARVWLRSSVVNFIAAAAVVVVVAIVAITVRIATVTITSTKNSRVLIDCGDSSCWIIPKFNSDSRSSSILIAFALIDYPHVMLAPKFPKMYLISSGIATSVSEHFLDDRFVI